MNYLESYKQAQKEWYQASAILGGLWGNCPAAASDFEDLNGKGQEFRDKVGVQHMRQAAAKAGLDAWKRLPKWQRKVCAIRFYYKQAAERAAGLDLERPIPRRFYEGPVGIFGTPTLSLRTRVQIARAEARGPEETKRVVKSIVSDLERQMSMELHK